MQCDISRRVCTGSNSCLYDGHEIVRNVRALGFILGDEGSNAYLGKTFIADVLKNIAPADLSEAFFEHFSVSPNSIMDEVYSAPMPSRALARYSRFLADHTDNPYVYQLVYAGFMRFFTRNIAAYDFHDRPICFVGSTCVAYRDILERAAADFGVTIAKAEKSSMPGLIEYGIEFGAYQILCFLRFAFKNETPHFGECFRSDFPVVMVWSSAPERIFVDLYFFRFHSAVNHGSRASCAERKRRCP